jgi:hypothetical protein
MKPDRYETSSAGRRRLDGYIERRGSKMGMPSWGGLLFGSLFVGAGTFIMLVGTKVLPVDPASVHAPYWVLTAAGASFALGGLMVWGMAWRQIAANRERRQAARRYADEPALADYHWHPDGFEVLQWTAAAKALGFAIGLTIFISIFNWWAFAADGGWVVKTVVTVFDCAAVALWWSAGRLIGCAFKFGHSRIAFTRFPYRLPEPVVVHWQPSDNIREVNNGTFTLRCVEEWTEVRGSGKNRSAQLVHEEVWSAQWLLDHAHKLQVKEAVELRYDLPPDALPTQLSADKPVFWELEVQLDLPGLDFKEKYLVPVYGAKLAARNETDAVPAATAA